MSKQSTQLHHEAAPQPLTALLGTQIGNPEARSFQLMGEDLWGLAWPQWEAAVAAYRETLQEIPQALRDRVQAEHQAFAQEALRWVRKYNWSIHLRIDGYLELGRVCRFEYPWPVVAILGICQVLEGEKQTLLYSFVGSLATRIKFKLLEQITDGLKDVLRRTNRGIFADSVPTVLYGLRAHDLRVRGEADLADALIHGPLPPLMDEQSRSLVRGLYEALAMDHGTDRFEALAALTLKHFEREQRIFSFHMGAEVGRKPANKAAGWQKPFIDFFTSVRAVPAPKIARTLRGRRVVFKPHKLPRGFDMRDHSARVEQFGNAFVRSITADVDEYRIATRYTVRRFGRFGERPLVAYPHGGAPMSGRNNE